jgi:hypothetical protein
MRAETDPRLRTRGHWDRQTLSYTGAIFVQSMSNIRAACSSSVKTPLLQIIEFFNKFSVMYSM